ncbi:MAG: radical SAM protein, partial [Nitrososphaerales archaeon]
GLVEFRHLDVKTILNSYKYRDNWFWTRYGVNPYRGCQMACSYCDAVTEKYLVHRGAEDFSRIIYVKTDSPRLLEKELERADRDVVGLSGVTDAYQPAERRYEITRRMLEVLRDRGFPVHIVTKSDLVLRDADLLSDIAERSWCAVTLTIITFDERYAEIFEPYAPTPERRIETVNSLVDSGIQAGVTFCPIIPYILDYEENLEEVVKRSGEAGAKYILPGGGMTLRSNQKTRFLTLLREDWPDLEEKYEALYRGSTSPSSEYASRLNKRVFELFLKHRILSYISPPDFDRPLKENFQVADQLLLIAYMLEMRAGRPYAAWAYHKAARSIEYLKTSISELHKEDQLQSIKGVGVGLSGLIAEYLETGRCGRLEELKARW